MFRGTGIGDWGLGKYTPYRQLITASFPIPYSLFPIPYLKTPLLELDEV